MTDLIIVVTLAAYGLMGYFRGAFAQAIEFAAMLFGFGLGLLLAKPLGGPLADLANIPVGLAGLCALLGVWFLVEIATSVGWRMYRQRSPEQLTTAAPNRLLGVLPSLGKGLILVAILLSIVAAAPLPPESKAKFTDSFLAKPILTVAQPLQKGVYATVSPALNDLLAIRTIKPQGNESVPLGFTNNGEKRCLKEERRLFELANQERRKAGLVALRYDDGLADVGFKHSQDMARRGYFSHNTPEGVDPFERMDSAGIEYFEAGENLALAPTTERAHSGLMNSPGHRENILKSSYRRLGVGCVDAGFRGKVYSQEFAK